MELNNAKSTDVKFEKILNLRSTINDIFLDIDEKLKILNIIHTELVKTHVDSNYRLGLDSFHFQNKLIQIENDNMKSIFIYIDNRIYCEYYKLYRNICEYINHSLNDKTFSDKLTAFYKKFPVYKDLEPTKIYDFNITREINTSINQIINELQNYTIQKKRELDVEQEKTSYGINIHNLINEQEYKYSLIEEKTNIFSRYLNTFHIHHTKYLERLTIKLELMKTIVCEDINLKQNNSLQIKTPSKDTESVKNMQEISNTPAIIELSSPPAPAQALTSTIIEQALYPALDMEEDAASV